MDVRLAFFSFTEITDPGAHRAYNEWHQLDHLPEQYTIPGIAYGERWVATPECRAARAVDGDLVAPAHYVTLYLMGEPLAETLAEFGALAVALHKADRFFRPRRACLAGPFDITGRAAADRVLVAADVVPMRPNRGVFVVVEDASGPLPDATLPALSEVPGVAGAWSFSTATGLAAPNVDLGEHRVTVVWLDDEPLAVAPALSKLVTAGDLFPGPVIFAGPFEAITPWTWDWFD
jgi:hypothetical protein